jgi:class 3 adenylate cyclase
MPKKWIAHLTRNLRQNFWIVGVIIALLSSFFTLIVLNNVSLATLAENHLSDVRVAMLSPPRPQSENIAIVLIDDRTLARFPYRSPLDRSLITGLLDELEQRSVAAIGINVLFDRPTEPAKDMLLYERLRDVDVPIVLSRVSTTSGFSAEQIGFSNDFLKNIRTGLSLIYRDPVDHTVRGSLLRQVQGRTVHLGFAATIADVLGIPLPTEERIYIDYRAGPNLSTPPFPIYAAHEVAQLPRSALENRIVLIGTDLSDTSRLRSPLSVLESGFSRDLPGIVIEAHVLSQLIENRSMNITSAQKGFLFILLMAGLGCLVSFLKTRLLFKLLLSLALLPIAWLASFSVYIITHNIVPMVAPTFAFFVAVVASIFWQWRSEFQTRERIHHAFGQFLAPAVVEQIVRNPDALELGGEVREITLLFSDLEGFTRLTESTSPQIMVRLVNSYLEEACAVVIEHGGTIDKIVGDALHVMFNAPLLQEDHAQRAVKCALALDQWSEEFRRRQKSEHDIDLGITRIGVNTGSCIVGNFGGKNRFDYTAHGDPINSAARLEAINQRLGTRICVSESTVAQCDNIQFRSVATLVLRGKTTGIRAFMPVAAHDFDSQLDEQYEQAYNALDENREDAETLFTSLETRYPQDPLVALHSKRIDAGELGTTLVIRKK